MLYFTYAVGKIHGIFSGRFAFKIHDDPVAVSDLVVQHIEGDDTGQLDLTLRHERAHHVLHGASMLGQQLVGQRFLARVSFALGDTKAVARYYEWRTCYFFLAHHFHEALVDRVMARVPLKLRRCEVAAIHQLDRRIARFGCTLGVPSSRWRRPLCALLGGLAQREFGVVLAVATPTGIKLREAATRNGLGGIINAAFQPSPSDRSWIRAIKYVHRTVNIEGVSRLFGRPLNPGRLHDWTLIKLRAEWRATERLFAGSAVGVNLRPDRMLLLRAQQLHPCAEDYFRGYLAAILPFALRFQGLDATKLMLDTFDLIERLLPYLRDEPEATLSARDHELLAAGGGLFFYHGN